MAPDDTRCRARYVCENAVEGTAIPEGRRLQGVSYAYHALETKASEILFDPAGPLPGNVDREQVAVGKFQHVRGLPTRRRTGVQYAHSGLHTEQRRRGLR